MNYSRASGSLLHITSLPGPFGIGDLGDAAFEFVDQLVTAGQRFWQILPLGPTGHGNSPYSTFSAFAGNTLLISPELLAKDGLVSNEFLDEAPEFEIIRVDFDAVAKWKENLLSEAFETFRGSESQALRDEYTIFANENFWWLDDHALFTALKRSHDGGSWVDWAEPLRNRERSAIDGVAAQFSREIHAEKFFQFLFFRQWEALKEYANGQGVNIIGDIPIFVAHDSSDVWCNQSKFKLNTDGTAMVVAGVPPDYFSKTGQLWGNPIYDWQAMLDDDMNWWTARIAFALRLTDAVRLDHFIGFIRNWEVPGDDETAENGAWVDVPGRKIFEVLYRRLGRLPIIAEDLGSMTEEVESLRDDLGCPGMRILQYAFGGDSYNRDLPHNYVRNCVVYTGTHDNDTIAGWYSSAPQNVKDHCRKYLAILDNEVSWNLIRAALSSVAETVIIPVQDILGLGNEARMNIPGLAAGNWEWRLSQGQLTDDVLAQLHELTMTYGRVERS